MTNSDLLFLETKSDHELLLLVAARVNEHTGIFTEVREKLESLEALKSNLELIKLSLAAANERNLASRLVRMENKFIYLTAGMVILAALAVSPEVLRVIGGIAPLFKILIP